MKIIPQEQVVEHLRAENPWWEPPHSISPTWKVMKPRAYLDLFHPLVSGRVVHRAIVLLGPRRVGKTIMIHHVIQKLINDGIVTNSICYVSVDRPVYNGLALLDIMSAYETATGIDYRKQECFFFFDEIQYLKDWEQHLKGIVDQHTSVKCVVSGSAAAALRLKSQESGAGRFSEFLLPPLTFHEYFLLSGKEEPIDLSRGSSDSIDDIRVVDIESLNQDFVDYVNFGGYPEVALSQEIQQDPGRYVKSDIVDKVLLRDLPSLYGVQNVQELNYLFTTLAFNTADEISLEQLSQGSGVAKNTIKRYIEYLEAAFFLRVVHRVDRNARRFKRANFFKIYLTNPSIRAALFSPITINDEAIDALVETAIFSQLFHSDINLHYARWSSGEVDIVNLGPTQRANWALEAKWTDRYFDRPAELKSLLRFCHSQNLPAANVSTKTISGTRTVENVNLKFYPASLYCYVIGRNLVSRKRIRIDESLLGGAEEY